MMNSLADLPISKLKRAVGLRERIESLKTELDELLGARSYLPARGDRNSRAQDQHAAPRERRGLTSAGRARIAAAQRLRWSKYNASRPARAETPSKEPRLSAEGRARVAAAVRARWDRYRAAKAKALRGK